MKPFLPSFHNVGILFDPARDERRAAEGAAALERAGYAPVMASLTGPIALPNALIRLTNSVDVLHALPDTTVLAREHSPASPPVASRDHMPAADVMRVVDRVCE